MPLLEQEQYQKLPTESIEEYNARIRTLRQEQEKGFASLTQTQKDIKNAYRSAVLSSARIEEEVKPRMEEDLKKFRTERKKFLLY